MDFGNLGWSILSSKLKFKRTVVFLNVFFVFIIISNNNC